MRLTPWTAIIPVLFFRASALDVYDVTVQTVNPDPSWVDGSQGEYSEQVNGYEPFRSRVVIGSDDSAEMVILMEEGLSDSIGLPLLQQWVSDIEADKYVTELIEISYGTPEEIKAFLDSLYSQGLEGAALVGNLPSAWVKVYDTEIPLEETLPCDYFFMDLDGEWLDLWIGFPKDSVPGQDGFYDTFQGELQPEIWVGRMKVDNLYNLGDPVEMLQAYLERNHEWRLTGDPEPVKALCYVDDDWAAMGPNYQSFMELLYENVELVNESGQTTAQDYEEVRLPDTYSWISPFVHSNPQTHFWAPSAGTTLWNEIVPIAPPARFYNLFACSNARFTTPRNMGGIYTFCTDAGLAAVGSTCSGAMLWFVHFYGPLGARASLGEAWKNWWDGIAANGFTQAELNWHIGMVLLGDPSLVPARHLTGTGEPEPGPAELQLGVSPNPASDSRVNVTFGLPEAGDVVLEVYDLTGRLVSRVVSGGCEAGSHERTLEGFVAGVYFVRLTGAGSAALGRFVVIE